MPRFMQIIFALSIALALGACEPWPRDPEHTTEMTVQSGELRVGVIHSPPWTDIRQGEPQGREADLLRKFANELGVTPQWRVFGVHEGFKALEKHEIDLLAGGLVQGMPYKKVTYTRPFAETRDENGKLHKHVLAVRKGENRFLVTLEKFLAEREGIVK